MRRVLLALTLSASAFGGFSENPSANNHALLVGVAQGLPGITIDIDNLKRLLTHTNNGFSYSVIRDKDGTVANIAQSLTHEAEAVDSRGTLLFYFTGHGAKGVVLAQDRTMKIVEIREALEKGRTVWGPMRRLVLFFDSCYSGSLLDPLNVEKRMCTHHEPDSEADAIANALVEAFSPVRNRDAYWSELIVFAGASANETCQASSTGSEFTKAFVKAFDSTVNQGTLGQFIELTKQTTSGSHPTARLVPESLSEAKF